MEPPPPRTIESLPNETLSRIFELIRGPFPSSAQTRWPADIGRGFSTPLLSAALVCRVWREEAQRELFQHVLILGSRASRKWLAESDARARFRVRTLWFHVAWPDVDLGSLVSVLQACEGIQALALLDPGVQASWAVLELPALAGLLKLELFDSDTLWNPDDPSTLPVPFHLSELAFGMSSPAGKAHIFNLLEASKDTLTTLSLRLYDPHFDLLPALDLVAPRVRRLTLESLPGIPLLPLGARLSSFTSLETLTLGEYHTADGTAVTWINDVLATLAPAATPTLRVLSFLLAIPPPPGSLLPIFHLPALAALDRIEFRCMSRPESLRGWGDDAEDWGAVWSELEGRKGHVLFREDLL